MASTVSVSSAFIWRRVHSLMGLGLVLFLFEHLITNSQAALWIGDDGQGFIRLVNFLESLPYLQVVEICFIGIPFAIHMIWGVHRVLSAKYNSRSSDGSLPALGRFGRNRAFTWQRLTSWILLFGVVLHVVQMRFVEMPKKIHQGVEEKWTAEITDDLGLHTLAPRLKVELISGGTRGVIAVAPSPGAAMLLMVRDQFKSPWLAIVYTIFVLAAVYHAMNGFWTSLITWGVLLSYRSQKVLIPASIIGMGLLFFLGLAAIWGTYWINLRG